MEVPVIFGASVYCIATTIRSRDVTCDTLPGPFTILGDL